MVMSDLSSRPDPNTVRTYLEGSRYFVNSELEKLIEVISPFAIHDKVEYALLSSGKRLRPSLVILSAECVGGEKKDVVKLATPFAVVPVPRLVRPT
jgi:geranylgeranyl pyrophosphate synthase